MHKLSTALMVLGPYCLAACVTPRASGVEPSGDPLAVDVKREQHRYMAKVQVGEVEHKDEHGHRIGSSAVYEDREVTDVVVTYKLKQGLIELDEQDFFCIANDNEACGKIQQTRQVGTWMNWGGWGVAGVGTVVALAGLAAPSVLGDGGDDVTRWASAGGLLSTGVLLAGGGIMLAWWGANDASRTYNLPMERAQEAAETYNATLETQPDPAAQAQPDTIATR